MKITHNFDFIMDAQKIFRVLLDCMANPGRVGKLGLYSEKLNLDQCHLLALGITLLDNESSFCAAKDDSLAQQLTALTLSRQTKASEADYLFLPVGQWANMEELVACAKPGDLVNPHKSATLVIEVPELLGECRWELSGPGIPGTKKLGLSTHVEQVIQARDRRELRFPQGIDLIFIDSQGDIFCLPRTTRAVVPNSKER